jgi:AGZA family xanthine/uracil permease-like MFS transporter
MPSDSAPPPPLGYRWSMPGDINAFFGLSLDNLADLTLTVSLLATVFGFPLEFALSHLVPGTAIGVIVGDLIFTWMAFRLAARTGRTDITAMPLGLDTPSTFGMVFFVVGPAFAVAVDGGLSQIDAARQAWQIGMCSIVASGVFKLACAPFAPLIRRLVPRAALLGSLAAIALALISFLPFLEVLSQPLVGLVSLGIVLATLTARLPLPGKIPGALAALLIGGGIAVLADAAGWLGPHASADSFDPLTALWPTGWLEAFQFGWLSAWPLTIKYLPIVIPFALGTVVGGIDCTESAAAAGDEFPTGSVIAVEGLATVVAGLCGGVIQSTPYIGHPAYKAMGGRAAYTLATAVFIGLAGLTGSFALLYELIPGPAILPILIFIGLEISAQSFHATPQRHYPAVAFACVPALAALVVIQTDKLLAAGAEPAAGLAAELFSLRLLASGFILTSLLWAGLLTALIDRRLVAAACWCGTAAAVTMFGLIHSPFADGRLFWPWAIGDLPAEATGRGPLDLAIAYLVLAAIFMAWGVWLARQPAHSNP